MGRTRRPAMKPENRENQLIDLAMKEVERRLIDGTITDGLLTQLFRMGSTKTKLEKENLRVQNELARAKTKSIESNDKIEALYLEAMAAQRSYSGQEDATLDD